jgi:hypothetical protein
MTAAEGVRPKQPGRQITQILVQPSAQKYSHFTFDPNHRFNSARLTADEGRVAIVTNVAVGCDGRSGAQDEARWKRTAKPCGPDAPTLAFKLVMMLSHHTGDGGNKARSPGRARSKPLKPLRREGRMNRLNLWRRHSCAFLPCTRGCGCGEHPAFPAPSLEGRAAPSTFRREKHSKNSGTSRRENADVRFTVIAGHSRSKNGVASARLCPAIHHLKELLLRWMRGSSPRMMGVQLFDKHHLGRRTARTFLLLPPPQKN